MSPENLEKLYETRRLHLYQIFLASDPYKKQSFFVTKH